MLPRAIAPPFHTLRRSTQHLRDRFGTGPRALPAPVVALVLLFLAAAIEFRTSALQSQILSWAASRLTYSVTPGPSALLVPPGSGPLDARRGYSAIPLLQRRLADHGFDVVEQAEFSRALGVAARIGLTPPQRPPALAGLVILGRRGEVLYDASAAEHRFERYEDIPPLVVKALLAIENRQLQRLGPRANPAVDWARLASATVLSAGHRLGLPFSFQGGSTLAVQMEKFRHSEGGRTQSVAEKVRQLVSASLAAYHDGPNTADEQRRIVLEYLNGLPLAATPETGEVYGLGNGLWAWFGRDPDEVMAAFASPDSAEQADAFKHTLAMIAAVRAPSEYLRHDPAALERRVDFYAQQMAREGLLSPSFLERVREVRLQFAPRRRPAPVSFDQRKAIDLVRRDLMGLLGTRDLYELDRLHLEVETTLDGAVQDTVSRLFRDLADSSFVARHGLKAERMLATGDPNGVVYSLRLLEHTADGERVVAHLDNLDRPLDVNEGVRLELGSTAKLRTLVHYLEIVDLARRELASLEEKALRGRTVDADPITAWTATQLLEDRAMPADTLMRRALERRYSASPESFFTGGGLHPFHNFDPEDDGRILSVREAAVRSTNLVFVRLMRDLVRFHAARLPYDPAQVLEGDGFVRNLMLLQVAEQESRDELRRAYREFHDVPVADLPIALLGPTASPFQLAVLFYAWNPEGSVDSLRSWLVAHAAEPDSAEVERLATVAHNPRWTIADYGWLLNAHPLSVWCAGALAHQPGASWEKIEGASAPARESASAWLLQTRNRRPQDLRLRTRIERDAFKRMTPYWRRLGFPFANLVPSLGTSIGSSADRPEALAELMGILVNDGVRSPESMVRRLRFAEHTPYHTVFQPRRPEGERLIPASAARALRDVLAQVVERGTAVRVRGAFELPDGTPIEVGGKTGSGDNRIKRFAPGGVVIENRAVSRTASFAFFLGDHHYGVLTASVTGSAAEHYAFTSTLPLEVMRLLAPALSHRLWPEPAADSRNADAAHAAARGQSRRPASTIGTVSRAPTVRTASPRSSRMVAAASRSARLSARIRNGSATALSAEIRSAVRQAPSTIGATISSTTTAR